MGKHKHFILLVLFSLFFANIFAHKLAENNHISRESFEGYGGWGEKNATCGGLIMTGDTSSYLRFFITEEMLTPMYNGSQVCIWTVFTQPTPTYYKAELQEWTLPSLPGCSNNVLSINSFKDRDSKSLITNGPYCETRSEFTVEGCLMAIVLRFEMSLNLLGKGFTLKFSAPHEAVPDPQDRRLFEMFYTWGDLSSLPYPVNSNLGLKEISVLSMPKGNVSESIWTFSIEILQLEFPNTTQSEIDDFGNKSDDFSYLTIWEITSDGRFAFNPLDIYNSINSSDAVNKVYYTTYGAYALWNGRNSNHSNTVPDTRIAFNYFTIRT